jgi:hypothetical protein
VKEENHMNEMNIYVETETTPVIKKDITTPLVAAILMQKTIFLLF